MATDVPIPRATPRVSSRLPNAGLALSGLAGTAGVIHIVASVEHVGAEWALGAFFLLVGAGQMLAAWAIYRDAQDMRMLTAIALASVGVALLWIFSRTTGLPFGPDAGEVAKAGVADTVATLQELGLAAIVALVAWRGERPVAWLSGAMGLRLTFAVLSLTLMMAALGGHEH